MQSLSVAFLMLAVPLSIGEDDITEVPPQAPVTWKEFKTPVGRILSLQSPAPGRWVAIDSGLDVASCADGKTVNLSAAKAAEYRLAFVGEKSFRLFRIVVGDPAPGPTPPDPKPPVINPLVVDLKAAMLADKASATDIRQLGTLLYTMANESKDTAYVTAKQLNDVYIKTRDSLLKSPDGTVRLQATRTRIAKEIAAIVDEEADVLTDDVRTKIALAYVRVADAVTLAAGK